MQPGISYTVQTDLVDEEDWATAWKKYYFPTKIGERLVICPSWESYAPAPGETVLTMDPGMAFGTGTHETTRLCIQLLEEAVAPGVDLLDIGTGSGHPGDRRAAVRRAGGRRASISTRWRCASHAKMQKQTASGTERDFLRAILAAKVDGVFPVVTANIVADVIIRLIPDLGRFLTGRGRVYRLRNHRRARAGCNIGIGSGWISC